MSNGHDMTSNLLYNWKILTNVFLFSASRKPRNGNEKMRYLQDMSTSVHNPFSMFLRTDHFKVQLK